MKTILVVEDEKDLRLNLQEMLEREGFSILTATNGVEALELTSSIEPDLILSDVRMPEMDGLEFLKALQQKPETASIPFIFLTARVEMQDLREGMVLGADDYLMKPFKIDDLLNAINSRLRKKENHYKVIDDFKKMLSRKIPHELFTPLVGILGFSEILESDVQTLSDEEIKSIAEKIKSSGKRLQRRIEKFTSYMDLNNLLDIKSGNDNRSKNMHAWYQIDPLYNSLKFKSIAASFNRVENMFVHLEESNICITEEHFENLMKELIENAAKFSESDTPIEIFGKAADDYYNVEVIDYGQGMKEININHIDLFNQNGKEFEIAEGLGIGLSLVQKIIELYNGFIKIESKPDVFTKISIGLPLNRKLKR
jgi:CheY-like chemotaxis protein